MIVNSRKKEVAVTVRDRWQFSRERAQAKEGGGCVTQHSALAPVCEVPGLRDTERGTVECCCLCVWLFSHRLGKTAEYLASEMASLQSVSTLGSQLWCRLAEVASL